MYKKLTVYIHLEHYYELSFFNFQNNFKKPKKKTKQTKEH